MGLLPDPVVVDEAGIQRNFDALARLFFAGNGSPEGVVRARRGAQYARDDGAAGSSLYVKTTSTDLATGWVAIA